jgi:hypothetical protein
MTSTSSQAARTPAQPAPLTAGLAIPKVAPQRRWRPSLIWLAVALIAIGGLISWRVLETVGSTAEYLAVGQRVEAGGTVEAGDLTTVRITVDPALKPIRAADAKAVIGKYAAVALTPGTLLTEAQLTDQAVPGPGKQLVGMSLSEDRVPSQRLVPGNPVLLVITADDNPVANPQQAQQTAPQAIRATVVDVRPGAKEGSTLLNVAVLDRDGPLVAARSAQGRIVVALTTAGN